MFTTTYSLHGNKGTVLSATVHHVDNNATDVAFKVLQAPTPTAHIEFNKAAEFIIAAMFDGDAQDMERRTFSIVEDEDGTRDVTHGHMVEGYTELHRETFTVFVETTINKEA